MKIKDAILPLLTSDTPTRTVDASLSVMEALPLLLDTAERRLAVTQDGDIVGIVTESSMLDALGRFIAARDDSSVLTIECPPDQYSASAIA
ncbi:MAG: CBS domain-containing protein, partial [Muribaculaceae bacterium]|nr:CBS domain-containing protein [Muribaculaceae bacterium]